jgi:hypothetical protein
MPNYTGTPTEVQSWDNTEYLLNAVKYWGIRSFTPPNDTTSVENVYGQGSTPIGWAKGNSELPDATMVMLEETYNKLKKDLTGGDLTQDIRNFSFEIIERIKPEQGLDEAKWQTRYPSVRITEVGKAQRSQGGSAFEVTLTLKISEKAIEEQITD